MVHEQSLFVPPLHLAENVRENLRSSGWDSQILNDLRRAALIHRQPLAAAPAALLVARRSAASVCILVCMRGDNALRAQLTPIVATPPAAILFEVRMQSTDVATARGGAKPPVEIVVAAAIALSQLRLRAFGVKDGHLRRQRWSPTRKGEM